MSARHKLNAAHLSGIFITAISLGLGTNNLWVGLWVAAALYFVSVSGGFIRRDPSPPRYDRRRRR